MTTHRYLDGEPCNHPGCLSHVTHPCEGCGRVAGRETASDDTPQIDEDVLRAAISFLQQASWYMGGIIRTSEGNPHTDTLQSIRDAIQGEYNAALSVLEIVKKEQR